MKACSRIAVDRKCFFSRGGRHEGPHKIFATFKKEFPAVNEGHDALGNTIHEQAGPLLEKLRWLITIAVSGASGHRLALETHIAKAKEAEATEDEIKHALLLIIQTTWFPMFMEAYSTYKNMR